MEYSILDTERNVVATASSACEARDKFRRGLCVFGQQTIVDKDGSTVSEAELESRCTKEAATEEVAA